MGHQQLLEHLRRNEAAEPLARAQVAGKVVYDFVYRAIASEQGVRIEDLIALLASNGGYACIEGTLDALAQEGRAPQLAGLVEVVGKDGRTYWFGDLPNAPLIEDEQSLLRLALGMAHHLGGGVSLDMVVEAMEHVAGTVGGAQFGIPRLPDVHRPGDLPIAYVEHVWPKIREALDLFEVPPSQRAMTIGFAVQRAIVDGKDVLDPAMAARICVECAAPMAKIDPARFA